MEVRLPSGQVISGVPDGTTRAQLAAKLKSNGFDVPQEWLVGPKDVPDSTPEAEKPKPKEDTRTFAQRADAWLTGAGEAGAAMVTGGLSGLAGRVVALGGIATGGTGETGVRIAQDGTFQPRTEEGKSAQEGLERAVAATGLAGLGPTAALEAGAVAPAIGTAARQASSSARRATGFARKVVGEALKKDIPDDAAEVAAAATKQGEAASHAAVVKQAMQDGYKVTLRQARPTSTTANLLEGASGSAKNEKLASLKNQGNTNRLLREDLELRPGQKITDEAIDSYIKKEGGAYQAVKQSGVKLTATKEYKDAVAKLGGDFESANAELPGLIDNPKIDNLKAALAVEEMTATTAVESVKYLRSQATKNLKAGFIDPEKASLGMAQRNAASAIDNLIEANLEAAGKKGLAERYRVARRRIARAHDIGSALNSETGNVDALHLSKVSGDKKVTGGVEKVVRFARSFSGSARNPDTMKDAANFSMGDIGLGVAGQLATGNIYGALAVGARPAIRSAVLSKAGQKAIAP